MGQDAEGALTVPFSLAGHRTRVFIAICSKALWAPTWFTWGGESRTLIFNLCYLVSSVRISGLRHRQSEISRTLCL